MMSNNSVFILCLSLMLASCSGDGSDNTNQQTTNNDSVEAPASPTGQADAEGTPTQTPEEPAPDTDTDTDPVTNSQGGPGFGSDPNGLLPFVQTTVTPDVEEFQNLSAELQAALSPECLLTGISSPVLCYVPTTRTLSAVSFDGTPQWSFPLPGSNATNRIEGLEQISFANVAIVANVTTDPSRPRQEISIFTVNGRFIGTYPLFDALRELNTEPGNSRLAVNIQGEPTLSLGVFNNFQQGSDSTRLVVAGNYYRLINGGDPTQITDWAHSGVVINTISTNTLLSADPAPRISAQFIPGAVISDAAVEFLDRTGNTVQLVLNDESFEADMLRLDNLPPSFNSGQPLNASTMHLRIPDALRTVESNSVYSALSAQLLSAAGAPSLTPGIPQCEPESGLPSGQSLQCTAVTPQTETSCFSGNFTDQISSERHASPEIGDWIIWTRTLVFNQCVGDNPQEARRSFRNGTLEIRRYDGDIENGTLNEEVTTFTNVASAFTPIVAGDDTRFESSVTGSIREAASTGNFAGLQEESSINISNYELRSIFIPGRGQTPFEELSVTDVITVTNHQFSSTEIVSTGAPDLRLSGSLNASYGTGVSLDIELSLTQAPSFANNIGGFLSVVQADGAAIRVSANEQVIEQHSGAALDAVFQSATGEPQAYTFPTEGLTIPWGSTPALQ